MIRYDRSNTLYALINEIGTLKPSTSSLDTAPWYIAFWSVADNLLSSRYGAYDLLDVIAPDGSELGDDLVSYGAWASSQIKAILEGNPYKYEGLYESTQFEYNPLFNVDGIETIERERHNTGTQGNSGNTSSSNDVQNQRTTYDSDSDLDTDKIVTSGSGTSTNTRTDNLTEIETITNTRQGNIGVTKTTELIRDQRDILIFDYADVIIKDFLPQIVSMVYAV